MKASFISLLLPYLPQSFMKAGTHFQQDQQVCCVTQLSNQIAFRFGCQFSKPWASPICFFFCFFFIQFASWLNTSKVSFVCIKKREEESMLMNAHTYTAMLFQRTSIANKQYLFRYHGNWNFFLLFSGSSRHGQDTCFQHCKTNWTLVFNFLKFEYLSLQGINLKFFFNAYNYLKKLKC